MKKMTLVFTILTLLFFGCDNLNDTKIENIPENTDSQNNTSQENQENNSSQDEDFEASINIPTRSFRLSGEWSYLKEAVFDSDDEVEYKFLTTAELTFTNNSTVQITNQIYSGTCYSKSEEIYLDYKEYFLDDFDEVTIDDENKKIQGISRIPDSEISLDEWFNEYFYTNHNEESFTNSNETAYKKLTTNVSGFDYEKIIIIKK